VGRHGARRAIASGPIWGLVSEPILDAMSCSSTSSLSATGLGGPNLLIADSPNLKSRGSVEQSIRHDNPETSGSCYGPSWHTMLIDIP
jgi:hypothetical protein